MVDIVEHVVEQQEQGNVIDIHEMKEEGILGGYHVIYHDPQQQSKSPAAEERWMFDYQYERLPPKPCGSQQQQSKNAANAIVATNSNDDSTIPTKTFFMPGRVYANGEPVSRSFRRRGYTPVDDMSMAQIIYNRVSHKSMKASQLQPWQYVTPFPIENHFFDETYAMKHHLDRTSDNGVVCKPLLYNGLEDRRFQIVVYWLILSIDPLLVLYHDGHIHLPYTEEDEAEFLPTSGPDDDFDSPTWRGSWSSFKQQLSKSAYNVRGVRASSPMDHVRNQTKSTLATVARDFAKEATNHNQDAASMPRYFALFAAEFEIDRNHNVFLTELHNDLMAGEDHQYIVDLHNELYGKALRMIETLNATITDVEGAKSRKELFTKADLGGYEWLIHPDAEENARLWQFEYDGQNEHGLKECRATFERPDLTEAAINWEKVKTSH
ncbi:MAG: hypothetical protein SGILL_007771 [Bacillariaceae sp.]